jgi:hypothetical protein
MVEEAEEASTIPPELEEWPETLMTNFDHTIDRVVEAQLRKREHFAQYSGWEFCGYVWLEEGDRWACEVWRYNTPREVVRAETLEAIMDEVSNKYGDG